MKKNVTLALFTFPVLACGGGSAPGPEIRALNELSAAEVFERTRRFGTATGGVTIFNGQDGHAVTAFFVEEDEQPPACEPEIIGPCQVVLDCNAPEPTFLSAGTIRITSLDPDHSFLQKVASLTVDEPFISEDPFDPDVLMYDSEGGDLFPISGGFWMPASGITQLAPEAPASGSLSVDRSSDLNFEWSGFPRAGKGQVEVLGFVFDGSISGGPFVPAGNFVCVYDGESGEATVPASVLSLMPPGDGFVQLATTNSDKVPGYTHVEFAGVEPARNAAGEDIGIIPSVFE